MDEPEKLDRTDVEIAGAGGSKIPMRTLFFDKSPDRELHIVASPDRMRVFVRLTPGERFSGVSREQLLDQLISLGVSHGVMDTGLNLLVALQNSPAPMTGYLQVARGTPRRKGEDGTIEFHVQPTSPNPRYDVGEDGTIDYRQLNLIENCFAGQRVASVLPPGPGRSGKNVFGEELPPVPGKPVAVRPGQGVVVSSNGREFTSEIEGRLVFEDDTLSISATLEITRDIDYAVGNVDFVGKVVVKGSLLDGFYINAKRGVEVSGDMGAARITSEGDVKIIGGIKGKNAAIISCRSLAARYIDDATVEATGDVTATKEVMNSSVQALGRIKVPNGAIIGGIACAFRGVEADTLGSEMGVTTWVMSGLNWTEENKKAEIRAKVAEYLDRVHSSQVLLDPLFKDPELSGRLGTDQKSMLSEIISELRAIREALVDLLEERASIANRRQEGMVNQINVRKMLYMGVVTRFSEMESEIKDTIKGPLTVEPDGQIARFGPFRELPRREKRDGEEDGTETVMVGEEEG